MLKHTVLAAFALATLACAGDKTRGTDSASAATRTSSGSVDLTGAGATFPYPIYSKWFADYARETGVRINYAPIGSGGGIRQLVEQTVDFGASDSPMTDAEMAKAKGGPILHIPTVLGAVVITYNVPGVQQPLKLDGTVLADIFLGKVKKWNDPRLASLNPGVTLPDRDILVVHRSDGSGTTFIFSDYLSAVSPEWQQKVGKGKELQWPVGLGAKGNEGVSGQVKQLQGAIGYTELAYAKQNNIAYADVRNAAGQFVRPALEGVTAAAEAALARLGPGTDYRVSIVNAPGAQSYPISSFTWILVYQNQRDPVKGKKLVDFLRWALTKGQESAPTLDYAPLPKSVADQLLQRVATVKVGATT